jgi:hypothetical protein
MSRQVFFCCRNNRLRYLFCWDCEDELMARPLEPDCVCIDVCIDTGWQLESADSMAISPGGNQIKLGLLSRCGLTTWLRSIYRVILYS